MGAAEVVWTKTHAILKDYTMPAHAKRYFEKKAVTPARFELGVVADQKRVLSRQKKNQF
jgi:hypothetical protein